MIGGMINSIDSRWRNLKVAATIDGPSI